MKSANNVSNKFQLNKPLICDCHFYRRPTRKSLAEHRQDFREEVVDPLRQPQCVWQATEINDNCGRPQNTILKSSCSPNGTASPALLSDTPLFGARLLTHNYTAEATLSLSLSLPLLTSFSSDICCRKVQYRYRSSFWNCVNRKWYINFQKSKILKQLAGKRANRSNPSGRGRGGGRESKVKKDWWFHQSSINLNHLLNKKEKKTFIDSQSKFHIFFFLCIQEFTLHNYRIDSPKNQWHLKLSLEFNRYFGGRKN